MSRPLVTLAQLDRFYKDLRASGINPVITHTTAEWRDKYKQFAPVKGQLVVYSDFAKDEDGNDIPGLKVGLGTGDYVGALPFITMPGQDFSRFIEHMNNWNIHVSTEDREGWNSKVSCEYHGESEQLTFK